MSNAIQKSEPVLQIDETLKNQLERIEVIVNETELAFRSESGKVMRALKMAAGIKALKEMITPAMMQQFIMPLMNTPIGFKTDQDPARPRFKDGQKVEVKPYPEIVVKECAIVAMLKGAQLVGNEFNIISGQAYFTKEFFMRSLGQLPDVTNVVPSPGIPQIDTASGKAKIRYGLSWKRKGQTECLLDAEGKPGRVFEIRCDRFSSVDQVIGKADRKAYAAAYKQIVGSELAPADGDVDDLAPVDGVVVQQQSRGNASDLNDFADAQAKKAQAQSASQQAPAQQEQKAAKPESDAQQAADEGDGQQDGESQEQPAQGQPAQEESQQEEIKDDLSTYEKFFDMMEQIAVANSISPSDCARAAGLALMQVGLKGKAEKTSIEWRTAQISAMREGRFDWSKGIINH